MQPMRAAYWGQLNPIVIDYMTVIDRLWSVREHWLLVDWITLDPLNGPMFLLLLNAIDPRADLHGCNRGLGTRDRPVHTCSGQPCPLHPTVSTNIEHHAMADPGSLGGGSTKPIFLPNFRKTTWKSRHFHHLGVAMREFRCTCLCP